VDIDGTVALAEDRVGLEVGEFGPEIMHLDDVGLALLEDVGVDGRVAMMGEVGVAE
jgi:hypothetical protein